MPPTRFSAAKIGVPQERMPRPQLFCFLSAVGVLPRRSADTPCSRSSTVTYGMEADNDCLRPRKLILDPKQALTTSASGGSV
jgi:hypothetical protein